MNKLLVSLAVLASLNAVSAFAGDADGYRDIAALQPKMKEAASTAATTQPAVNKAEQSSKAGKPIVSSQSTPSENSYEQFRAS